MSYCLFIFSFTFSAVSACVHLIVVLVSAYNSCLMHSLAYLFAICIIKVIFSSFFKITSGLIPSILHETLSPYCD